MSLTWNASLPPFPYAGLFTADWRTQPIQHFVFKLALSPGTYQISVLPDLMVLTTAVGPTTADDVTEFFSEVLISSADISRTVNWWDYSGQYHTGENQIASLLSSPDTLATQAMQDAGIAANYGSFYYQTATVTIEPEKTITYSGGARDVYTADYYLSIDGWNISYPTPPSGTYVPASGRFLITIGNPTGQRTLAWGEGWLNVQSWYEPNQPPPDDLDPQGLLPIRNMALLANAVYERTGADLNGWRQIASRTDGGELQAIAYQNSDGTEVAIAIRGTNFTHGNDWVGYKDLLTDIASFPTGVPTDGLRSMVMGTSELLRDMVAAHPNAKITLTGHSLGGAVAQLVARASGYTSVTFNAPGTDQLFGNLDDELYLASQLGLLNTNPGTHINYRTIGDVVSLFGTHSETCMTIVPPVNPFPDDPWHFVQNHVMSDAVLPNLAADGVQIKEGIFEPSPDLLYLTNVLQGFAVNTSLGAAITSFAFRANMHANWMDPTLGTHFIFAESLESPSITSVTFPEDPDVALFKVWSEVGNAWLPPQSVAAGVTAAFLSGTHAFMFEGISASGEVVSLPGGYMFDAIFAAAEQVTANLLALDAPPHLSGIDYGAFGDVIVLSNDGEVAYGGDKNDTIVLHGGANTVVGGAGSDYVLGAPGIDTAKFSKHFANYSLNKSGNTYTVRDNIGTDGSDTLQNVERLQFSDTQIALDLAATQSSGKTVLLLGAVLPDRLVFDTSKQALLGAVIDLFDQGYSLQTLSGAVMRLPIWDVLTGRATPSNTDIATYLLTNVNGAPPDATTLANAVTSLNTETDFATQGNFLWHLAESATNQTRVDLVGLATTGLVYCV